MLEMSGSRQTPEIAAGSMQLQPLDETSRPGAVAALGKIISQSSNVWVARDVNTGAALAYVALDQSSDTATVHSTAGLTGTASDAKVAADVVRRYAAGALGLAAD